MAISDMHVLWHHRRFVSTGRGSILASLGGMAGRDRLANIGGRLLCIAAAVWMAWIVADLLWLLSGHNRAPLAPPPAQARRAAPAVDVGQLASLNLFGAPPVASAQPNAAADAPDTTLQLRLTGVFVNTDPSKSGAIVAERSNPNAPAKVYHINDNLPGGATLSEVHDDRILLKRGSNSEILRFEKTGLLDGTGAGAGRAPSLAEDEDGSDASGVEVRSMLGNAIQALTVAPEAFVQQMGLKPGPMGYEITEDTPDDLRAVVGLQPGDRILSVNGRRLGNPRQDRDVLAALRASGSARVEVQRGGQVITIERKF